MNKAQHIGNCFVFFTKCFIRDAFGGWNRWHFSVVFLWPFEEVTFCVTESNTWYKDGLWNLISYLSLKTHTHAPHTHTHTHTHAPHTHTQGCDKAFATKDRLTRHMDTHRNAEQFPCPHTNCSRVFLRQSHLQSHLKTHNQESFACRVVGKFLEIFLVSDSNQYFHQGFY